MVRLFRYEGYDMVIDPEALLLKPFRAIWERDDSDNKLRAKQELGYVYFFCDPRSDYGYLLNERERGKEIALGLGLEAKWKPDKLVKEAMKFYSGFKPISAGLLEDTLVAVDKLRFFLRGVDLLAVDDKGKPIYTAQQVANTIKMIPDLVKNLKDAERMLNSDIEESQMRGSMEKTVSEDLYV